jgi:cytochrome P450
MSKRSILLYKTILSIASGSCLVYLAKIWLSYRFFARLGIPTPVYEFFYGNFREIQKEKYTETLKKWTRKYGKTYGYYEGHYPILVTSDVDLIREIFITKASNFSARKFVPAQYKDNDWDTNVGSASKLRWKRMRTILNPTFSPQKLKEILPLMKMCTDRFLSKVETNLNKEIVLADDVKAFAMDTLANCVFGITSNIQDNKNSPLKTFFDRSNELIDQGRGFHPFILLNLYFYEFKAVFVVPLHLFGKLCQKLGYEVKIPFFWLQRHLFKLVSLRLAQKSSKTRDYLQIMIESLSENSTIKDELTSNVNTFSEVKFEKKMTIRELSNNLFVFLIAGYDTTYTTLNYCLYVLSKYPNEMLKLQDEIDSHLQNTDENVDYEILADMKYLDYFLKVKVL